MTTVRSPGASTLGNVMLHGLLKCLGAWRTRAWSKMEHRLIDVLAIAVRAVLAGAESFEDIALDGHDRPHPRRRAPLRGQQGWRPRPARAPVRVRGRRGRASRAAELVAAWPDLRRVVAVETLRLVENPAPGTLRGASREVRYHLTSSAAPVGRVAEAVRAHRGIERRLHWVLDTGTGRGPLARARARAPCATATPPPTSPRSGASPSTSCEPTPLAQAASRASARWPAGTTPSRSASS